VNVTAADGCYLVNEVIFSW